MAFKADELKKLEKYADSDKNQRISKSEKDEDNMTGMYGFVTIAVIQDSNAPVVRKGDVLNAGSFEYNISGRKEAEPVEKLKLPYVMGESDADAWINKKLRDPESRLSKAVAQYR